MYKRVLEVTSTLVESCKRLKVCAVEYVTRTVMDYACPENGVFKKYFVRVDENDNASIRHIDRPDVTLAPDIDGRQVGLSFVDGKGNNTSKTVNFRKVVFAFMYPDACMEKFKFDMFDQDGKSSASIHIDHIIGRKQGGTEKVSNLQLLPARENSKKSHLDNPNMHAKIGATKSNPFEVAIISIVDGKTMIGPYIKFKSLCDPWILETTKTACGNNDVTVDIGYLNRLINGKGKRTRIGGSNKFFVVNPDSVRDQDKARREFGGKKLLQAIIDTTGKAFKKHKGADKLLFRIDGQMYNIKGQIT
jgi:hypothetical protein